MTPEQQNDLLIRVDQSVIDIKEDLARVCKLAKSKDGFPRCANRQARLEGVEWQNKLITAALLVGAAKLLFF